MVADALRRIADVLEVDAGRPSEPAKKLVSETRQHLLAARRIDAPHHKQHAIEAALVAVFELECFYADPWNHPALIDHMIASDEVKAQWREQLDMPHRPLPSPSHLRKLAAIIAPANEPANEPHTVLRAQENKFFPKGIECLSSDLRDRENFVTESPQIIASKKRFKPPPCPECNGKARVQKGPKNERFRRLVCTVVTCEHTWKLAREGHELVEPVS